MSALKLDIEIEQGSTFQREFTVLDSAGVAFDLTGYTTRGKLNTIGGVYVANFATSATGNKLLIELTAVQTAAFTPSTSFSHKYDIEAESPSGIVYRIAQGSVVVSAEQTK